MKVKDIALDGVVRQNPIFRLVLGTCPTLAVTSTALGGLSMGLAVTFVLLCSNVIISLLRNIIPDKVRIPCYIVIIATFVTIVKLFLECYIPSIAQLLGSFLSLIVVNCIILGRAESFASQNPVGYSALDGIFMGVGVILSLTLMGIVRELLASASVFGLQLWDSSAFSISFFGQAAGGFITYAIFIALFNYVYGVVERKIRHNNANKILGKGVQA